jgi:alpha-beta hydrolase superfamily lysophospholipase
VYPRRMPRPEEVRFRAGELELAGELLLPEAPPPDGRHGRYPWVLLAGSWLPRDRNGAFDRARYPGWFAAPPAGSRPGLLARLAAALADRGVASFRYDPRGCGASDGDWPASSLFARIDDARDALGALRGRRDLDLARTGIAGHGEGATIALSVAIADPAVSALTLVGTAARGFRDVLRRGVARRARTGAERSHRLVAGLDRSSEELIERADRHEIASSLWLGRGERVELDLAGWRQAFDTPPLALATMLHRSVALVHGAEDAWSHPDESRLLATALAGAGSAPDLRVIAGVGHDLAEAPDPVIGSIAAHLAARLRPRDLPPVLVALQELE